MFLDITPLRRYRDYRLLFTGQMVSMLGSMITYVVIPYQIYEITKSSLQVGLLGIVQLVPIIVFGLIGGSVADRMDRRKLLIWAEAFMSLGALALAVNAAQAQPSVHAIFVIAALMQAANGFHRPAMDALAQKLVEVKDYPAVGALGSLKHSVGSIIGPAIGGIIMSTLGTYVAYVVDFATFMIALTATWFMRPVPRSEHVVPTQTIAALKEGLMFAFKRPELMGTYIIDIVAMTFAFPIALFPALGQEWGGPKAAGALLSAMSVGALTMTLFSGWTKKVKHHGRAVVFAAAGWGLAIVMLGFAPNLTWALIALGLAGASDMISGLFRGIIWNETIPNEMRGRLAGVEMISYMSGPLLGNARSGWVASLFTTRIAIMSGGWICVAGVGLAALMLPAFWRYHSRAHSRESTG